MLEDNDIDKIINYLGQPEKKIGNELIWQCPICQDTHRDNLKLNLQKRVLKCFANDRHVGEILRAVNKQSNVNYHKSDFTPLKKPIIMPASLTEKELEENLLYMCNCNDELLNNPKALKHLEIKRGITKTTAAFCGIGIDTTLHQWVLPIFEYDTTKVIGFEYRPALLPNAIKSKRTPAENESKKNIRRKKGSLSGLAAINSKIPSVEVLAIVEGFFDGYALCQYLQEQGQDKYYHIVTPSNGISSLEKQIKSVNFSDYKQVYLYVDTDDKSKPTVDKILCEYPFIKQIKTECCKDFNEHYMKCIKGEKGQICA